MRAVMPDAPLVLQVLLHGQPVGTLTTQTPATHATVTTKATHPLAAPAQGWLQFAYLPQWLQRVNAVALSPSLPLRSAPFGHRACHAWFAGLLPSGPARHTLARQLQISADDDLALLDALGGDCLGAVQLVATPASAARRWQLQPGMGPEPVRRTASASQQLTLFEEPPPVEWLSGEAVDALLVRALKHPLLAGAEGQSTWPMRDVCVLPIVHDDAQPGHAMGLPTASQLSTHLLWLASAHSAVGLYRRYFCTQVLQAMPLQLPVQPMRLLQMMDVTALLQPRADRQQTRRMHAETLAQALNWAPGVARPLRAAGWPACFDWLRQHATPGIGAVLQLLDAIIASVLVGDATMSPHKLMVLHQLAQGPLHVQLQLAPLWDVDSHAAADAFHAQSTKEGIPTAMEVPIGHHVHATPPSSANWDLFARQCGLSPNQVRKRVRLLAERMLQALRAMPEAQAEWSGADEGLLHGLRQWLQARATQCAHAAT